MLTRRNITTSFLYNIALIIIMIFSGMFLISVYNNNYMLSALSIFIITVGFFILLSTIKINTDSWIERYLVKILRLTMRIDGDMLIEQQLNDAMQLVNDNIKKYRTKMFVQNGCLIPCTIIIIEIMCYITMVGPILLFILFTISTLTISTFILLRRLIAIKNSTAQVVTKKFYQVVVNCSRGLKLYNGYNFVNERIINTIKQHKRIILSNYSRIFMASIGIYTLIFLMLCLISFVNNNFYAKAIENIGVLSISTVVILCISAGAYYINDFGKLYNFEQYMIDKMLLIDDNEEEYESNKIEEPFINFNDVSYIVPNSSAMSVVNHMSFAIEPGDFVVITGEMMQHTKYIYDLIFKHHIQNSGVIYISGINSNGLSSEHITNIVGYFDEDFCLMFGTVWDNIAISTANHDSIIIAASKAGLDENDIYMDVCDEYGRIVIDQATKIKIQIARMFLHKYKIIAVNSPKRFDSKENEALFYNFIKSIMNVKTILLATKNLNFIMYSSKVLYLGEDNYCFGAHSDILNDRGYYSFILASGYNVDMHNKKMSTSIQDHPMQ